jgi:hypothetical protein
MKVIPQLFAAIAFFTCMQGVLFSASKPIGQRIADAYKKTPTHAKQAALGVPLLALGIILQSSYGNTPGEISHKISALKRQLGRGNNKTLKRQIRKLRLKYGGHVALQVLAAIAGLVGGSLTLASLFGWWNARQQPEAHSDSGLSPRGPVVSINQPARMEGDSTPSFAGATRFLGRGIIRPHTSAFGQGKTEYCSACGTQRYVWNYRRKVQSGDWRSSCVPRQQPEASLPQQQGSWLSGLFRRSTANPSTTTPARTQSESAQRAAAAADRRRPLGDGASEGQV